MDTKLYTRRYNMGLLFDLLREGGNRDVEGGQIHNLVSLVCVFSLLGPDVSREICVSADANLRCTVLSKLYLQI